jgi:hypothetical protein
MLCTYPNAVIKPLNSFVGSSNHGQARVVQTGVLFFTKAVRSQIQIPRKGED